jgi:hypothetical protein
VVNSTLKDPEEEYDLVTEVPVAVDEFPKSQVFVNVPPGKEEGLVNELVLVKENELPDWH